MLLWTLQLLRMQQFQGQAQGQAELLCLPKAASLFFTFSTIRTSTQFLFQETAPTFLWDSDIPRNSLLSKQEMGQAKMTERPGSDKPLQALN